MGTHGGTEIYRSKDTFSSGIERYANSMSSYLEQQLNPIRLLLECTPKYGILCLSMPLVMCKLYKAVPYQELELQVNFVLFDQSVHNWECLFIRIGNLAWHFRNHLGLLVCGVLGVVISLFVTTDAPPAGKTMIHHAGDWFLDSVGQFKKVRVRNALSEAANFSVNGDVRKLAPGKSFAFEVSNQQTALEIEVHRETGKYAQTFKMPDQWGVGIWVKYDSIGFSRDPDP